MRDAGAGEDGRVNETESELDRGDDSEVLNDDNFSEII